MTVAEKSAGGLVGRKERGLGLNEVGDLRTGRGSEREHRVPARPTGFHVNCSQD